MPKKGNTTVPMTTGESERKARQTQAQNELQAAKQQANELVEAAQVEVREAAKSRGAGYKMPRV